MNDRVKHAALRVVGPDGATATRVMRAAEPALSQAVQRASANLGDEVLIIRRIDLALRMYLDNNMAAIGTDAIATQLATLLRDRIAKANRTDHDPDVAYFPTEAACVGAYIVALCEDRASAWPYRVLTHYGTDPAQVLEASLQRDRLFAADVMAALARTSDPSTMAASIAPDLATRLTQTWLRDGAAPLDDLPREIAAAIATRLDGLPVDRARARFIGLCELFDRWPPARELSIDPHALDDFITPVTNRPDTSRDVPMREAPRRLSVAGGLVLWARLLDDIGLTTAVATAYPDIRTRRSVLWALGRALESASASLVDPLLLLFSGEEPDSAFAPRLTLERTDPEPFARAITGLAAERNALGTALRIAPFLDQFVVLDDRDLMIDVVQAPDGHSAVEQVVHNFVQRAGRPPSSVEVVDLDNADRDAIAEVSVPILPDTWRGPIRFAASLCRNELRTRHDAAIAQTRRWSAVVVGTECIELRRRDVQRVAHGSWLHPNASTDPKITIADRVREICVT